MSNSTLREIQYDNETVDDMLFAHMSANIRNEAVAVLKEYLEGYDPKEIERLKSLYSEVRPYRVVFPPGKRGK